MAVRHSSPQILDELIVAGEMQESSKKSVLRVVAQSDAVEESENGEDVRGRRRGLTLTADACADRQPVWLSGACFRCTDTSGACRTLSSICTLGRSALIEATTCVWHFWYRVQVEPLAKGKQLG